MNYRTRRAARERGETARFYADMANGLDGSLIAFLVAGQFVTVLYYPFFWINFAMSVALNRSIQPPRGAMPGVARRGKQSVAIAARA